MFDTFGHPVENVTSLDAKELTYSLQTSTDGSGPVLVLKLDLLPKEILVTGVILVDLDSLNPITVKQLR